MNRVLFRADSSSSIGTGHIMRDLVLAKQYPDSKIVFATQELKGNLNSKIIKSGYVVEPLVSNDVEELISLVKRLDIDMVIIDHYGIDYTFEKALKVKTDVQLMVLDDTYEEHFCDLLLNHNIYADENRYKDLVPKNCELQCGKEFTLLRDEFTIEKQIGRQNKNDKVNLNVFIAMGGADHSNINTKILKVLTKFPSIHVHVVTTMANKHLEELKNYIIHLKNITLHINTNKIAKLMNKADFAIITPSVTLNEIFYLNVPFIAIRTADNQKHMCKYLEERNLIVLDNFNSYILSEKVSILRKDDYI